MVDEDSRVWFVVGADGNIGSALLSELRLASLPAAGSSRRSRAESSESPQPNYRIDLADHSTMWELPEQAEVAILTAAITSIETCRRDPDLTRKINVERTLELADMFRKRRSRIIFLSTNQVFDGSKPHVVASEMQSPQTEYGSQKAEVERKLLDCGETILRLSKVISGIPPLLLQWAKMLTVGGIVEPFSDLVIAPVPLKFVTKAIISIGKTKTRGIVQISGDRDLSYADIAIQLAYKLGVPTDRVRPVTAKSRGLAASAAPRNTTLDTSRLLREFGLTAPPVEATIADLLDGIATELTQSSQKSSTRDNTERAA